MSSKSSEFPTMRALLVGAALTGLLSGTTSAQAAGSNPVAKIAGQVATSAGENSMAICRRCNRWCMSAA